MEGFYYYLYGLTFYLQLAYGPQISQLSIPAEEDNLPIK